MAERRAGKAGARPAGLRKATKKEPRLAEERILSVLREAEAGATDEELCGRLGISREALARRRAELGALGPSDARRLKQLEEENRRLRSIVADLTLSNQALKIAVSKKW
jgi:putative transposase